MTKETIKEQAELLGINVVSRTYVYRLRKSGNVRSYEIGYIEQPTTAFRKEYPDSWCDSRICEGFWGNEEMAKKVVSLLNDC